MHVERGLVPVPSGLLSRRLGPRDLSSLPLALGYIYPVMGGVGLLSPAPRFLVAVHLLMYSPCICTYIIHIPSIPFSWFLHLSLAEITLFFLACFSFPSTYIPTANQKIYLITLYTKKKKKKKKKLGASVIFFFSDIT
jgi:hypothetical protein